MNTNSNTYIFTYATLLVVVVAVVLAVVAAKLRPIQDNNVRIEKMESILKAAMPAAEALEVTPENALQKYEQFIVEELVVSADGEVLNTYNVASGANDPSRGFDIDLKVELDNLKNGEPAGFPIFIYQNGVDKNYVIPVRGTGLWGPIWGYIALKSDRSTVVGTIFDHKGETPGLGAEIATPKFEESFIGKSIFNTSGDFTSVAVVKGGISRLPAEAQKHAVDAITGSTITSTGVSNMLENCLKNYTAYFEKIEK